jgi:hypothetical protein
VLAALRICQLDLVTGRKRAARLRDHG